VHARVRSASVRLSLSLSRHALAAPASKGGWRGRSCRRFGAGELHSAQLGERHALGWRRVCVCARARMRARERTGALGGREGGSTCAGARKARRDTVGAQFKFARYMWEGYRRRMLYVGRLQTAHGTRVTHRRDARLEAGRVQ
jgi:hypothetical protein